MDPVIRHATVADLDGIQRIQNHAILTGVATWDEEPWPFAQRLAWFEDHLADGKCPVLVLETDALPGQIAGYACLSRMSQKSGYRFSREDTIYLDPAVHGRGFGRLLLARLLDEARTLGLRLILASIESENAASLALHRALGFRTVGTVHNAGYKFGRWLSTTYMELDLHERP